MIFYSIWIMKKTLLLTLLSTLKKLRLKNKSLPILILDSFDLDQLKEFKQLLINLYPFGAL